MEIKIYHNPDCGTSRNTLALIRNTGVEPHVTEYLKTPPSHDELREMIARAGLTVREAVGEKGSPSSALGLTNPSLSDEELLDAMLAHPILINRPFLVTPNGVRLCRPRPSWTFSRCLRKVRLPRKMVKLSSTPTVGG